ncbi:S1 family peptidase [Nocardia cyriacigeorgica]|uniref:S1 family peptidase n=1 Tax=Nocardia cyriacigeorgica TaxID=135487 RepID=UPI001892DA8A|nr:S1 family peptidase [Nocardia cyriacigeorgica]MBF6453087.1 protease [Nocardia cyriacigeorgica]MBF6478669.1 protease [Nocardia cyriacigeorgica]MBF6550256.1 protease [Nocardia cyriacigeorgica]
MRKAAIAASAAILLFGPTAAVASAQPDTDPGLPAELITAVSRDLKISADEYLRRADLAQQVAAFSATAQRQFPQVFGGAWLDDAGKAVVALAPGSGIDEARAAAESAGFEVRNVAKSQSALRGEKSAFERWLDEQPEPVASLVRGVVIDTVNNSIAVRVDKPGLPMPSFVDPARVIVMAPPVAGEALPSADPIAEVTGASLAGGDGYASVAGRTSLRCSFGFNGVDRDGATVNVTAGHCNPDIASAGGGNAAAVHELLPGDKLGGKLGTFSKSVLGNQDYSIVRIADQARDRFANNAVRVPGAAPILVDGVATPVVGAPVCKSGSRTGFSCGVVNAVDQTVQVGDRQLTQSFSANICALPGDSGGPIVTGRLALGISSASSVADFPVCEIPNLIGALTGNTPQLFAQPVSVVLSDNPGLRIRTN